MRARYNDLELLADALNENDSHFSISVSNHARHKTASTVDNVDCATLEQELKNVVRYYEVREFLLF